MTAPLYKANMVGVATPRPTKIALVCVVDSGRYPPLGLMHIIAYLRHHVKNVDVRVFDRSFDNVEKEVARFKPDIVGISVMTPHYSIAVRYAENIKKAYEVPVVIGGIHVSVDPLSMKRCFDVGVLDEGEVAFSELVQLYQEQGRFIPEDLAKIKGLCYWRDGEELAMTERRPLMDNLDDLPFIDYGCVSPNYMAERYYCGRMVKLATMLTSRGCPFKCLYCCGAKFFGHSIRMYSPRYVAEQITRFMSTHGNTHVEVMDDFFAANIARIRAMTEAFREKGLLGKIRIAALTRADSINDEMCMLLKELGVQTVNIGFESGSERVLKYLKGGTTTPAKNRNAVELLAKHGILPGGNVMLGSPTEKLEDMEQSIEFIKWAVSKGAALSTSMTTPYPGTPFWDIAKERGTVGDTVDFGADFHVLRRLTPLLLDSDVDLKQFRDVCKRANAVCKLHVSRVIYDLLVCSPLDTTRVFLKNPLFYLRKFGRFMTHR